MTKFNWDRVNKEKRVQTFGSEPCIIDVEKPFHSVLVRSKRQSGERTSAPLTQHRRRRTLPTMNNLNKRLSPVHRVIRISLPTSPPPIENIDPPAKVSPELVYNLSPLQLENLISALCRKLGYETRPSTDDIRINLWAERPLKNATERLAIRCKQSPGRIVGAETAMTLFEAILDEPEGTQGVLITTGSFSINCKAYARDKRIALIDIDGLCNLVGAHSLLPSLT